MAEAVILPLLVTLPVDPGLGVLMVAIDSAMPSATARTDVVCAVTDIVPVLEIDPTRDPLTWITDSQLKPPATLTVPSLVSAMLLSPLIDTAGAELVRVIEPLLVTVNVSVPVIEIGVVVVVLTVVEAATAGSDMVEAMAAPIAATSVLRFHSEAFAVVRDIPVSP